MKLDTVHTKSCRSMSELPDNSIDLLATDPPYGIAFMGKSWDKFNEVVSLQGAYEKKKGFKKLPRQSTVSMQEFFVPIWKECLRVLKPGAFGFVMCSPRADVMATQILCLQEAGFKVGFSPMFHAFAQGFPKAMNIGKAVDKRLGAKRKVTGKRISAFGDTELSETKDGRNLWGKQSTKEVILRGKSATPQAQALDGSYAGMQLKPSVEVVLVAMKSLSEKTYVDQALANGKGVSWLGDGRIPYKSDSDKGQAIPQGRITTKPGNFAGKTENPDINRNELDKDNYELKGRFPANLLVSDDALNDGRVRGGGKFIKTKRKRFDGWREMENRDDRPVQAEKIDNYGDSGSFSRYFSLDAWFEKRLKELPAGVQKTFPFLIVPKASRSEKNRGCEGLSTTRKCRWNNAGEWKNLETKKYGNIHPTCKPLKLMSYLITLGSREGDVILDPFIGSGTTAIAAKMLRRHYIGYEIDEGYVRIAKARLSAVQEQLI